MDSPTWPEKNGQMMINHDQPSDFWVLSHFMLEHLQGLGPVLCDVPHQRILAGSLRIASVACVNIPIFMCFSGCVVINACCKECDGARNTQCAFGNKSWQRNITHVEKIFPFPIHGRCFSQLCLISGGYPQIRWLPQKKHQLFEGSNW